MEELQSRILDVSRFYSDIYISDLSSLLGVPSEDVELQVRQLIKSDKLVGAVIDQVDGIVLFDSHMDDSSIQAETYNEWVQGICEDIQRISEVYNTSY